MSIQHIKSVISVIPVTNFELALQWYIKFFGREPDIVPMEGIAEWQLAENALIQVSIDPERAGKTTVVIEVSDVELTYKTLLDANFSVGKIEEYPDVVKIIDVLDPEGNKMSFVQDISPTA